jgi:hypothetical protein
MKSFRQWCEDNGRNHTGHKTYAQFVRTAKDYEKYREETKKNNNNTDKE